MDTESLASWDHVLYAISPFRPPDWRFLRVRELTNSTDPLPCRRDDDRWVRRYKAYRVRLASALFESDSSAIKKVIREFSDCHIATQLRNAGASSASPKIIEARILAQEPFSEIASKHGTTSRAIECYEAIFFNVTDRIGARDWITTQVLVPALTRQTIKNNVEIIKAGEPILDGTMKLFGYFCGPIAVDILATGIAGFQKCRTSEEFFEWFDTHWKNSIRRRSTQAVQHFEVNNFNATELFALHARIIELEQSPGIQQKAKGELERRVKTMLDLIPWSPATRNHSDYKPGRIANYSNLAAELNDEEYYAAAAGNKLEADEEIMSLTVPPPRRATPTSTEATISTSASVKAKEASQ